jgi:hypothetical protein
LVLRNRLYNAIATLRSLGLRDLVVTCDDGYRINPAYQIVEREADHYEHE